MSITYETKGTDLGGQSGRGTDLTTGRSEVDNLFEMSNLGEQEHQLITMRLQRGSRWWCNNKGKLKKIDIVVTVVGDGKFVRLTRQQL